jgi:hypothetical protein
MRNLAETVERLQLVKQARGRFLGQWAAECIFDQKRPVKRALKDVLHSQYSSRIEKNAER